MLNFLVFSIIAPLLVLATPSAQARQNYCPAVPSRANAAATWDEVVQRKRVALQEGLTRLEKIRMDLVLNERSRLGQPGDLRAASVELILVAREITALIDTMVQIFRTGGTKIIEQTSEHFADIILENRTRDLIDYFPYYVPGKRLVRSLEELQAARRETRSQLDKVDSAIKRLRAKLDQLGGEDRTQLIKELLELARVERRSCEVSVSTSSRNAVPPPPEATPRGPGESSISSRTTPIDGPCRMFRTC